MDIVTDRLTLHPLTPWEAQRIVDRKPEPDDVWHADYPLDDELNPLRALAESREGEAIFTLYSIRINDGDVAVGGIGFFGPPDVKGSVEIGYGLVESVRGRGLATEALIATTQCALRNGAVQIKADTDLKNYASQRVLVKAGFTEVSRSDELIFYEFG